LKKKLDWDFTFKLCGIFLLFLGFAAITYMVPGKVSQYGLCSGDSYPFGMLGLSFYLIGTLMILMSDILAKKVKK
jgi:hypothetical protein